MVPERRVRKLWIQVMADRTCFVQTTPKSRFVSFPFLSLLLGVGLCVVHFMASAMMGVLGNRTPEVAQQRSPHRDDGSNEVALFRELTKYSQ